MPTKLFDNKKATGKFLYFYFLIVRCTLNYFKFKVKTFNKCADEWLTTILRQSWIRTDEVPKKWQFYYLRMDKGPTQTS